jgi:hypothetical protein
LKSPHFFCDTHLLRKLSFGLFFYQIAKKLLYCLASYECRLIVLQAIIGDPTIAERGLTDQSHPVCLLYRELLRNPVGSIPDCHAISASRRIFVFSEDSRGLRWYQHGEAVHQPMADFGARSRSPFLARLSLSATSMSRFD